MDEILEELYTLLDLYFRIEIGSGMVTPSQFSIVEPALDRKILQEDILKKVIEKSQELQTL